MTARKGWAFVDHAMQRQIEKRVTTAEAYELHFREEGLMPAWTRYLKWTEAHPGEDVPDNVNRVGTE